MNKPKSNCCNAAIKYIIADEGTGHMKCSKCLKPCDMSTDNKEPAANTSTGNSIAYKSIQKKVNLGKARNKPTHHKQVECFCQSYYDDNNVLRDCTCGKCECQHLLKQAKERIEKQLSFSSKRQHSEFAKGYRDAVKEALTVLDEMEKEV